MSGIEPGHDDELRRRLHEIPSAGARLDTDAIIAGARKRRRPKTIALSSAATVAGVLIVAPFVVPGLSPLQPVGMTSVSSDSGAAPESAEQPAPGEQEADSEAGTDGATDEQSGDAGAAEDAGSGDTGASGPGAAASAAACTPGAAGDAGLALRFLDDPSDGTADLAVENLTGAQIEVRLDDVGSVELDDAGHVVAAGVWPGRWSRSELGAGAGGDGGVTVDLEPRVPCADPGGTDPVGPGPVGEGPGIAPVATVLVTRDGEDDASPLTIVGEPFGVR